MSFKKIMAGDHSRKWAAVLVLGGMILSPMSGVACDTFSAETVVQMLGDPHMTSSRRVENGKLIYQWGSDFSSWDATTRLKLAQTAADADACLTGRARTIEFYSPYGVLVENASPGTGVVSVK